jgi:phage tail-like protein
MATSTPVRPLASDPLRSFKFNVFIPNKFTNGNATGMARFGYMSVSGLGVAIESLTYREGGDNITTRKMPGQADINPLTCSRGEFATDSDTWLWMTNLFTAMYGGGLNPMVAPGTSPDFRTYMYVNVLEHPNNTPTAANSPVNNADYYSQSIVKLSFKLYSAWIGTLAYSDLDAGGNAVGVEQMTINYEGFDMNWGGTGYVSNPTSW